MSLEFLGGEGNSAGAALGGIQNKTRIEQNKEGKGGGGGIKIKAEIPPKIGFLGNQGKPRVERWGRELPGPRQTQRRRPFSLFPPFPGEFRDFCLAPRAPLPILFPVLISPLPSAG